MKLSNRTIKILKNFSDHNSGIFLRQGKLQRTVDKATGTVLFADAEIDEDFPIDFGIIDLKSFLNCLTSIENPDVVFSENEAVIKGEGFEVLYRSSPEVMIVCPPPGKITLTNKLVTFKLSKESFRKILSLSSMIQLNDFKIVGQSGKLFIQTEDGSRDEGNSVKLDLSEYEGEDFSMPFDSSYLNFLDDDYVVTVYKDGKGAAQFVSGDGRLVYSLPRKANKRT